MRRQSIAILALALLCTGASGTPAPANLSAQQILAKTAENYRGVTGYAVAGSIATHMVIQGQPQDVANTLFVAYGGPGRSRFEADTPNDRMVFVNSADSSYTFASSIGQYMILPRKVTASNGLPAVDPNSSHPFEGYGRLADHVASATLVGRDTATVNGKTVATYVIDVSYDSTVAPLRMVPKPKRLVIDAGRFVVVGDATAIEREHPALPDPIKIEQNARYTSIEWNVKPPDSLFAFAVPRGASRVDKLDPESAPEPEGALTGQPAEDFTLLDLKGVKRALSSHRGSVVLLDFWATWCGPCRREMPIIAKLHERYAKRGLVVYGVNCSETTAKAKAFVEKYGYTFPQLLDKDGDVQTRYQITAIPTVFIVDKKGTIRAHLVGGRSEDELLSALERAGLDIGP